MGDRRLVVCRYAAAGSSYTVAGGLPYAVARHYTYHAVAALPWNPSPGDRRFVICRRAALPWSPSPGDRRFVIRRRAALPWNPSPGDRRVVICRYAVAGSGCTVIGCLLSAVARVQVLSGARGNHSPRCATLLWSEPTAFTASPLHPTHRRTLRNGWIAKSVLGPTRLLGVMRSTSFTDAVTTLYDGGQHVLRASALVLPPPALRRGALPTVALRLVGAAPRVRDAHRPAALLVATGAAACHSPRLAAWCSGGQSTRSLPPSTTPTDATSPYQHCDAASHTRRGRPSNSQRCNTPHRQRQCTASRNGVCSTYHTHRVSSTWCATTTYLAGGVPAAAAISTTCNVYRRTGAHGETSSVATACGWCDRRRVRALRRAAVGTGHHHRPVHTCAPTHPGCR